MTGRTTTVPVLPVADVIRSTAWYQRLGFELQAEYEGYAILALDGAELHLNEMADLVSAKESMSGVYLRVADVDATFAHWAAMGVRVIVAPEDQDYGIREFATEDLDGNLWRVGSPIGGILEATGSFDDDLLAQHRFDGSETEPDPGPSAFAAGPSATDTGTVPFTAEGTGSSPTEPTEPWSSTGPTGSNEATELTGSTGPTETTGSTKFAGGGPGAPVEARTDGGPGTTEDAWFALVTDHRTCAGCGLPNGELAARALGAQVRDEVHAFGEILAGADDDEVRRRPSSTTWSALEYGVHTRDTLTVYAERIIRTLAEHQPELGWWDHEAAIDDGMANESDVGAVVDDLGRNAAKLSEALRLVTDDDWERSATRRPGERFTIEAMARFALHEVIHHRADAQAALAAASR